MADIKNPERQGFESSDEGQTQGERFGEQAREAVGRTREAASAASDRIGEKAHNLAEQGKSRLAQAISDIGVAIREAGHKLHDEQQEGPAGYVDQAADQVDSIASYLQNHDVQQLYGSVENTARQHPAIFIGATFACGLVAARFLRSSGKSRSGSQQKQIGSYGTGSYGTGQASIGEASQGSPSESTTGEAFAEARKAGDEARKAFQGEKPTGAESSSLGEASDQASDLPQDNLADDDPSQGIGEEGERP
ncbi:hypothetical protein ACERK3_16110 [Phycisphaerales bacterium AB-hyl4]|uniref:DUF3618 domain-containing protein n=1 Tax=Natronomicrosphaera hydrolytica TaxID=3242702 RepID=A0ABV4U876_9BACT